MTVSILDRAISEKIKTAEGLRALLQEVNLTLFHDILDYKMEESWYVIMFIMYAYSEESPWLITRANSEKEQMAICQRLQMPEYIKGWVLTLPQDKPELRRA